MTLRRLEARLMRRLSCGCQSLWEERRV